MSCRDCDGYNSENISNCTVAFISEFMYIGFLRPYFSANLTFENPLKNTNSYLAEVGFLKNPLKNPLFQNKK